LGVGTLWSYLARSIQELAAPGGVSVILSVDLTPRKYLHMIICYKVISDDTGIKIFMDPSNGHPVKILHINKK
jgi:hypothetical protein